MLRNGELLRNFIPRTEGSVAVIFGISAIPIALCSFGRARYDQRLDDEI